MSSKENKQLRAKVEQLEKENRELKKSVFHLSYRLSACLAQIGKSVRPFSIDDVLTPDHVEAAQGTAKKQVDLGSAARQQLSNPDFRRVAELDGVPSVDSLVAAGAEDQYVTRGGAATVRRGEGTSHRGAAQLVHQSDLKAHTGAVYTCKFSRSGRYLASGSFDKTVRVWSLAEEDEHSEVTLRDPLVLQDHTMSISDVDWSATDCVIASASFDHSARTWDVPTGKCTGTFGVEGFVQSVVFAAEGGQLSHPAAGPLNQGSGGHVFFAGTTHKDIHVFDGRAGAQPVMTVRNDAMVNSLLVNANGTVTSGDGKGMIKTWELRWSQPGSSPGSPGGGLGVALNAKSAWANEDAGRPITHLHSCTVGSDLNGKDNLHGAGGVGGAAGTNLRQFLAVNSYDNILRVYDMKTRSVADAIFGSMSGGGSTASAQSSSSLASNAQDGLSSNAVAGGGGSLPGGASLSSSSKLDHGSGSFGSGGGGGLHREGGGGGVVGGGSGQGGVAPTLAGPGAGGAGGAAAGSGAGLLANAGAGVVLGGGGASSAAGAATTAGQPSTGSGRLLQSFMGHKNKNWPIKSSFFRGHRFTLDRFKRRPNKSTKDVEGQRELEDDEDGKGLLDEEDDDAEGYEDMLLLATGSADNSAYLYSVGATGGSSARGSQENQGVRDTRGWAAQPVQKLEGHNDRVYSATFHPTQPVLATTSADFSIKIWAPEHHDSAWTHE